MSTIAEYRTLLSQHDWWYDYSDDYSVWSAGRSSHDRLLQLRKAFDPKGKIWNEYAPDEMKVKEPKDE